MKKALAGAFAGASLLAALALALAACGGSGGSGGSGGYGSPAPTTTAAPKTAGVEVTVASAKLGMILADAKGRTLYVFLKDKGDQSACAGACASTWPALTVTGSAAPTAGSGVDGTTSRATAPPARPTARASAASGSWSARRARRSWPSSEPR